MSIEAVTLAGVGFGAITWLLLLSFHAGKLAERVKHLGDYQRDIRDDIKQIFAKIDNLWGRKFDKNHEDS